MTATAVHPERRKAPFFVEFYRTSLGKKYVMAVTGLIGLGFIFFHMLGNLKMYLGPEHYDAYAEWLRNLLVPFLPRTVTLWIMRVGVIVAVALHIHAAVTLTKQNREARPVRYATKRDYIAADYASRTMRWSGVIVLLFIVWHLFDLSWTGTTSHFVRGHVYANVAYSLDRWPVALFYIVANVALAFHLYHGVWSLFQSLGWNNPRFNRWRRGLAIGFAVVVCGANISFPIAVLTRVVHVA
ncbi:MAG: succinate dehydrogenase cytochrome b subunit [Actinobacteria bacterium]|nr:succinate dehydrogenase cytochrome b subunit [Actinomycetota bacterium]